MLPRIFNAAFRSSLSVRTFVAMGLGTGVGLILGPQTAQFGFVAKALIALIKAFATPLLFFAILDAWTHATFRTKGLPRLLVICAINGAVAIAIALGIHHFFAPGTYLILPKDLPPATGAFASIQGKSLIEGFFGNVPDNLLSPFLSQSIPGVILLAILIGVGINRFKREALAPDINHAIRTAYEVCLRILETIVKLSPIAVFAAVAQAVGTHGFSSARGLAVYLLVMLGGMLLHVIVTYQLWILCVAKVGLRRFWRIAKEPVFYAAGVNSSLATLPITLRALERLGVSPASARLSACVGTNFNNDGILLYEAAALLLLAQASGVSMSWADQLWACGICVIAAFGVAGVPEAGLIGLALVMQQVGVPAEILPLLMTVDWIVARARSATNVLGDLTVAVALDSYRVKASGDGVANGSTR